MQSHWMINQATYDAVQETIPIVAKYHADAGTEKMAKTPIHGMAKKIYPDVYKIPLFRRQFCKLLVKEIDSMRKEIGFEGNKDEDTLRQIPEIVLQQQCPELYRNMWFVAQTVLNPIFMAIWQRSCGDPASIQIANYNLKDKKQGAWHHDASSDVSIVVPLNTGNYKGGGTEFLNRGVIEPLPTGSGLIFPSYTHMHRGLAVEQGDRYLLVFWLTSIDEDINSEENKG